MRKKKVDWQAAFATLKAQIKSEVPNFRIVFKERSLLHRLIGFVLFFNRDYMTNHVTTIYPTVAWPNERSLSRNWKRSFTVLLHERAHLLDWQDRKVWFPVSYLLPQLFALGALGALLAPLSLWFLLCLVFLVFLAPFPSRWREDWELRGHEANVVVPALVGEKVDVLIDGLVEKFTGPGYYWMTYPSEQNQEELEIVFRMYADDAIGVREKAILPASGMLIVTGKQ